MPVTFTYDPVYPVPGDEVTFTAAGATGTSREYELTSAPDESTLSLARLADESGEALDYFTPDQPGEYVFTIYDYKDTGFAPARWTGDVTAQRGKRLIGTGTTTVYVGEEVDLPIVTLLGHGATLRLTINNSTVREATIVDPLTEVSRLAILDSDVQTKLSALVTESIDTLGNDIATGAYDLVVKYEAHRQLVTSVHAASGDLVNAMLRVASSTYTTQAYGLTQLNEARERIEQHMRSGTASGGWHRSDDTTYTLLVGAASDLASATVLLADLGYRVYERHRTHVTPPDVHIGADNTNALVAAEPLTLFIVAFLDAIEIINPAITAGESEGAGDAAHRYGFKRAT